MNTQNPANRKKVLLTGADGLLGTHISRLLTERGYQLRAFVERNKAHETIASIPGIELIEGDILNPEDVMRAINGTDFVIHAAANTSIQPARSAMVRKINVTGTEHVLNACMKYKTGRLVFVGTANSFNPGPKSAPGDETGSYTGSKYRTDYMDSKYEAYQMIKAAAKAGKIDAVTVHPTFMLGSFDTKPSSGAMLLALYQKKVPGYSSGGRNYINVQDAAMGVIGALEQGRSGESYILGNENLNYREAFEKMSKILGVKAPSIFFPNALVYAYGGVSDLISRILGKQGKVSLPMARISCDDHYYTAQKAVKELGLPQNPLEMGIKDCFEWFLQNNYLNR